MSNGQLRCSKVDELKLCVCSNTGTRFTILKVSGRSWHLCLGVLYVMADGCAADDSGQKVTHSHWNFIAAEISKINYCSTAQQLATLVASLVVGLLMVVLEKVL